MYNGSNYQETGERKLELQLELQNKIFNVLFSKQAVDELVKQSHPLLKVMELLKKHKETLENVQFDEPFIVVDVITFSGKKNLSEIHIERVITDSN